MESYQICLHLVKQHRKMMPKLSAIRTVKYYCDCTVIFYSIFPTFSVPTIAEGNQEINEEIILAFDAIH